MFIEILNNLLDENKLTKADLSKLTGISPTTIQNWFTRNSEPRISQIEKIADYFETTVDYLIGRENYATGVVEVKNELTVIQTECLSVFDRLTVSEKNQAIGFMKYFILQRGARV